MFYLSNVKATVVKMDPKKDIWVIGIKIGINHGWM